MNELAAICLSVPIARELIPAGRIASFSRTLLGPKDEGSLAPGINAPTCIIEHATVIRVRGQENQPHSLLALAGGSSRPLGFTGVPSSAAPTIDWSTLNPPSFPVSSPRCFSRTDYGRRSIETLEECSWRFATDSSCRFAALDNLADPVALGFLQERNIMAFSVASRNS